jgi:UDP-glucose 4-epimerase
MKQNILITGGNGFIGTQVADLLYHQGHYITVVDRDPTVKLDLDVQIVEDDYYSFISSTRQHFDTVIHLAADMQVEQSVRDPKGFYTNNVLKMKGMLDELVKKQVKNIIFSSSACVYGRVGDAGLPLKEDLPYDPGNTYGSTKVAGEMMIKDYARAYGLNYVIFRYFNVAGADPAGKYGYTQRPASHVIPLLCNKILKGIPFTIYGDDYDTTDGTCVRDYIHVADVARAHSCAIEFIEHHGKQQIFNLGGINGTTVKELVAHAADVVGKTPEIIYANRRPGDAVISLANAKKAEEMLGWIPEYNISDIIDHAWAWEQKFEGK